MLQFVPLPSGKLDVKAMLLPDIKLEEYANLSFAPRRAKISDVRNISALINEYASAKVMLPRGPQYIYENIKDYMVVSVPGACNDDSGEVAIACGAMHVVWEDLAEVRSLAVHPNFQRRGLGSGIVEALILESKELAITHLFTFTLLVDFFKKFGFADYPRNQIPSIVWNECSRCAKYYNCDETAMILQLNS